MTRTWVARRTLISALTVTAAATLLLASRAAAAERAVASCVAVEGLTPLLVPGSALLFGEMHGTVESPRFVGAVACQALAAGLSVTVALEIPREEQARVDTFLASTGSAADRAALLTGPFWTAAYQDGRRSAAMVDLLDELRRLRSGGGRVRGVLIDRELGSASPAERDGWMADAIAEALAATGDGVVLALTGNVHSRIARGVPWDPTYPPAGYQLTSTNPQVRVTALDVGYAGGTAWTCTSAAADSCQARTVRGRAAPTRGTVVLDASLSQGHHGIYWVGELTASPPAVRPKLPG